MITVFLNVKGLLVDDCSEALLSRKKNKLHQLATKGLNVV